MSHVLSRPESTSCTVAECIIATLHGNGIDLLPMVPGGPLMPLLHANHLARKIRTLLCRHESGAVMVADGCFRVSGRMQAAAVTAGPGLSNAATAVALARSEQVPLLVLSAQVARSFLGRGAAQELDTVELLRPITKASVQLQHASQAEATVVQLLQTVLGSPPGPVHLSVPADLWGEKTTYSARRICPLARALDDSNIEHVAGQLDRAAHPVMLVGSGCTWSGAEHALLELAEVLPHLRFATTPRAKGTFPEDHSQSLGVFGFAGHEQAEDAMLEVSDLIFVAGSRLGEIATLGWDPRFARRPIIQLDHDPTQLGKNYAVDTAIVGDAKRALEALVTLLRARSHAPRVERLEPIGVIPLTRNRPRPTKATHISEPSKETERERTLGVSPISLMRALGEVISADAHVFVDIGNTMAWAIRYLQRCKARRWHVNLCFGCMGHAIPAAVGASLMLGQAVVALVGDAAFAMSGFELHTAVENGLPLVVVVLNDSGHGMVEMGSRWQFGQDAVPNARFNRRLGIAQFAAVIGAEAATALTSVEARLHVERALKRQEDGQLRGPLLIDVHIDPTQEPPFGARLQVMKNFSQQSKANEARDAG